MLTLPKINTRLLPMKVVMFGYFGASSCAIPFMSIHMKELGLTVKETAAIYTLLPITQTLSAPIAGLIADRLGKYRDVLLVSIIMQVLLVTSFLYVPTINESVMKRDLEFPIDICDQTPVITEKCGINSDSVANNTDVPSCQLKCEGRSNLNVTLLMVLDTLRNETSNLCDYRMSQILSENSNLEDVCRTSSQISVYNCSIICELVNVTSIKSSKQPSGRHLTFYLYSVLRVLHNIFSAIGYILVNSCALALTETNIDMGEYGRQRFWAIVAMAVFPPFAGVLVDVFNSGFGVNYAPAFHTHNIVALSTCIAVWYLNFEMEDAPESYMETFKNFWLLIRNPAIFFLLVIIFWLGTMYGFMESFLFWFLLELGSPTYLLGLTVTIGSIAGLPFLYYARLIVSKLGYANVLSIAVIMYMIRCIGTSYLNDAWWVMPLETLEIFSFHLMWVAAATYAAHLSPTGLLATIQGFVEGVHFGVGQGSGSLLGGFLISEFGNRSAFRAMGIISGAVGILYTTLHFFWLRKENVRTTARRASIKSFPSQKNDQKESSAAEVNGIPTEMNVIVFETCK